MCATWLFGKQFFFCLLFMYILLMGASFILWIQMRNRLCLVEANCAQLLWLWHFRLIKTAQRQTFSQTMSMLYMSGRCCCKSKRTHLRIITRRESSHAGTGWFRVMYKFHAIPHVTLVYIPFAHLHSVIFLHPFRILWFVWLRARNRRKR